MKKVILAVLMLSASAASSQEVQKAIDLSQPFADARVGVAWNLKGEQLGVAYVPIIYLVGEDSKREYVTLNLGASYVLSTGKSDYLVSVGARIDTIFAKLGESKFAQKYLRFAVLPPLQISPSLLTADFKHFTWYLTISTKFGRK